MFEILFDLLGALVLVFIAAELFTNALEIIGERIGVSEGVTGSVFAAVGTAMPETIVPIVAIVAGGAAEAVNHAVGMGAILGAPFMLATMGLGLMAVFAGFKRGWGDSFHPERTGLSRDINVFLFGFGLAVIAGILPASMANVKMVIAFVLFITYFMYLLMTIRASKGLVEDGHGTEADNALYFSRLLGNSIVIVVLQLLVGLAMLVWGAMIFVHGVELASGLLHVSPLLVSMLIVPIATELPEKVNSILWIRKRRDTLAFGNITGAMVFQGTVIPAIGILILPWNLTEAGAAWSVGFALLGCFWLWVLKLLNLLKPAYISVNILLYFLFVALAVEGF
ncbi:MAG: sodium:calcium antiporter [Zetaproteobacteria bacterium]|nr:sodium:calcium antiporter [Zetaproteobacteria bacterium]